MNDVDTHQALTQSDLREHAGRTVISHHTLAERLDVEPHDLVKVMRRLAGEDESFGSFDHLGVFSEPAKSFVNEHGIQQASPGKTHYLLDEHRAITVTLESRSKRRHALRNEIVTVFLAAKNGATQGALTLVQQQMTVLADGVKATGEAVSALARQVFEQHETTGRRLNFLEIHAANAGRISDSQLVALKSDVRDLAQLEFLAGNKGHKNQNSARRSIWSAIGEACSWGGSKQPWADLPRERLYAARLVIERRKGDVQKLTKQRERQLALPTVGTVDQGPENENGKRGRKAGAAA